MKRVLALTGALAFVAACSVSPPRVESSSDAAVRSAWVELGDGGVAIARAITSADACPTLTVDGVSMAMRVRVAAGIAPKRPTDAKPSAFPVTVCEREIPQLATAARIGARMLPVPRDDPRRIVVFGDTGCRLSSFGPGTWQSCDDPNAWPFATVAATVARFHPDLVIHVGDYHYREAACPGDDGGCRGSPWGYGYDAWDADFFEPAAPLFAAAPWIFVRGNHEECARAGQGWFRFLDPYPYEAPRSCDDPANDVEADYSKTYAVPLAADLQLIVFDSAKAAYVPLAEDDPQFRAYRKEFDEARALAERAGVTSFFAAHHPLLAFVPQSGTPPLPGNAALLSVARTLFGTQYFPAGVALALHGHIHDFQAIGFASGQPPALVAGIGGVYLDVELPDPFPAALSPAPDATVATIAHSARFGFVVLERQAKGYRLTAYTRDGRTMTRCALADRRLDCDKTGLVALLPYDASTIP